MYIEKFKKIVIKVGSSILMDKTGKPKKKWLQKEKTNCYCLFWSHCYGLPTS